MIEFQTKKKFGQNFLRDKNLLMAICGDAEVCQSDEVLEIGAGLGALTECLEQKAKKVISYEIDSELFDYLKEKESEKLEFRFKDVLSVSLEEIEKDFEGDYKIVANIPYYITTPIIFKFLGKSKRVKSMTLMVQKEVAERIVAKEGGKDYGVLSVCCSLFGEAQIKRIVGRNMFHPAPNVDSAIVHIDIVSNEKIEDGLIEFIKNCFSMRRKTLLNNLSTSYSTSKQKLQKILGGVDLTRRAETFSKEEFLKMYDMLKKNQGNA